MSVSNRLPSALLATAIHLGVSALATLAVAALVFGQWFPAPLHMLTGGQALFLILMVVNLVCGPVLTLVLYNPVKARYKWLVDLALIVVLQLGALTYGLSQLASARPVLVAFEGDRFRIVQAFDVNADRLGEAPSELQSLSYLGPKLVGVRLAKAGDADYLVSVQMSIQGLHPAFRPSRWQRYESQVPEVLAQLKPLEDLRARNPGKLEVLNAALTGLNLSDTQVGYLPLVRDVVTDWVVLVDRSEGMPLAYLHLNGW